MNEDQKKKLTVNEVSRLTGVSVRTLHYYDQIGLLSPAEVTESGYRLYGTAELIRLQDILLFRELEFPLKEIARIIGSPKFDRGKALEDQIRLLELKRDRLEELIRFANRLKIREETYMSFKAFDKSRIEAYQKLAKETWGETEAYREFEKKDSGFSETEKLQHAEDLMDLFYEFGDMKTLDPGSETVQAQVKKLQGFITEKYYTCTDVILSSLGQMYASGGEMTSNIDAAGGNGTAEFVSQAIEIYCKSR